MNETGVVSTPKHRGGMIIAFGIFLTIGVVALLGLQLMRQGAPPLASGNAPAFEIKSFDGETFQLANLRGKAVVVNFWASWCVPCRDEAPLLESTWKQYRDQGLVVVGVDYVDTETEARKFIQEFGITYPNGPDLQTRISQAYRITGVPETYFITREGKMLAGNDANGRALGNWIGPLTQDALAERVNKLLGN